MAIQLPYTGVTTNETIPAPYTNGGGVIDLTLKEDKANKGVANGYAPLDANAKVPVANLPAHKSTHATGGADALTPSDIGAQPSGSYAPATGIAPSAITGTAVITNDSRLSDARTPVAHSHAIADVTSLQATLTAFAIALG